jgi:hypothetical protein
MSPPYQTFKSPATTFLGNAISVRGTAIWVQFIEFDVAGVPDQSTPYGYAALINNSLRGTIGASVRAVYGGDLFAVNNIVEARAFALNLISGNPPPEEDVLFEVTLKNNDLVAATCAVATAAGADLCAKSPAEVDACDWMACKTATGTRSVAPGYVDGSAFVLAADSSAIDAGIEPTSFCGGHAALLATDANGDARPKGAGWDLGYDEF